MKVLVIALFVACATAQYFPYGAYPYNNWYGRYWPSYYPAATASQYHSQDALGQASYGYAYPGQAATNYRDAFGNQVGSYAYINPEGKEVRVSYVADANGFRVLSNDLPVAPDAPAAAPLQAPVFDGQAPEPVQDTAEVAAAKAEFFRLYKEAAAAAAAAPESRKKRQVLSVLPNKQFADDLHWQSVDLNQDGQPDVPVYPVAGPVVAAPYTFPAISAPLAAPLAAPFVAPPVSKYQVKTAVLAANEKAATPSATIKLDAKEITQDVVAPLAYLGFHYPAFAPAVIAAPVSEKKTESRKKRQIPVFPAYRSQFYNDLMYNSVDLNQDGQPDKAVVAAPAPIAYSGFPYTFGYPFYG